MTSSPANTITNGGGDGGSSITAADIAARVGGELLGGGDSRHSITGIAPLDRAGLDDLSFLASARYSGDYESTRAGVVLIRPEFKDISTTAQTRIVVEQPQEALVSLLPDLYPEIDGLSGIHPTATLGRGAVLGDRVHLGPYSIIGEGAQIGDGTVVGAHCVVGPGVAVGRDCFFHPSVTVYSGSRIADRVIVQSGARIGSDGFGYLSNESGHQKIRHVGRCIIDSDVEIGANTCIDRGSIDDTVVGEGTKIDNLVHVGHNVRIGRRCLILAQVGIAGSCRIEDGAVLAGQVGIGGHLTVGRGARVGAQGGVMSDIPPNEMWSGYPARPHRESMRAYATLFKLEGMMKKLEGLLGEEK